MGALAERARVLLHLCAWAQVGVLLRVVLGALFGGACGSPLTLWAACVTSDGARRPGGALFNDLPANIAGCFLMGLFVSSDVLSNSLKHTLTVEAQLAAIPVWSPLQAHVPLLVGLRTGLCGSLTTFASWMTQVVVMLVGGPPTAGALHPDGRSQWVEALAALLLGTLCALGSLVAGQHAALWLYHWLNPGALIPYGSPAQEQRKLEASGGGGGGVAQQQQQPEGDEEEAAAAAAADSQLGVVLPTTVLLHRGSVPLVLGRRSAGPAAAAGDAEAGARLGVVVPSVVLQRTSLPPLVDGAAAGGAAAAASPRSGGSGGGEADRQRTVSTVSTDTQGNTTMVVVGGLPAAPTAAEAASAAARARVPSFRDANAYERAYRRVLAGAGSGGSATLPPPPGSFLAAQQQQQQQQAVLSVAGRRGSVTSSVAASDPSADQLPPAARPQQQQPPGGPPPLTPFAAADRQRRQRASYSSGTDGATLSPVAAANSSRQVSVITTLGPQGLPSVMATELSEEVDMGGPAGPAAAVLCADLFAAAVLATLTGVSVWRAVAEAQRDDSSGGGGGAPPAPAPHAPDHPFTPEWLWWALLLGPFGCYLRFYLSRFNGALRGRWSWLPAGTYAANVGACLLDYAIKATTTTRAASLSELDSAVLAGIISGVGGCLSTVSTWAVELQRLLLSFPNTTHAYDYLLLSLASAVGLGLAVYGGPVWAAAAAAAAGGGGGGRGGGAFPS